jgi:hypothetical protein
MLVRRLAIDFHKLREVCTTAGNESDGVAVWPKAVCGDLKFTGGSMV